MTVLSCQTLYPKLTIGIPVYNGECFLRKTLESVLSQSYKDFTLIVSDNASTDTTGSICKEFAEKDNRISYVRQEINIGAFENFKFVLSHCKTDFFVFLAADDSWAPGFLQKNVAALENNKNAVCSVSKTIFEKKGKVLHESNGTYSLEGDNIENLKLYILGLPNDNSRFYGVFRASVLQQVFASVRPFHAADWYLMALTLSRGTHIEIDEILMHRETAEYDRYMRQVTTDNKDFVSQAFPVFPMTCALIKSLNATTVLKVFWPLLRLNFLVCKVYFEYRFGRRCRTAD